MSNISQQFTLLIVDDEKQNRLLLTELFQEKYKIIQAKNGEQALKLAKDRQPDLILLDVLMPEMDGLTVVQELKRIDETRHIPVIFITALSSPEDEERGLNMGAVDYISKPFHAAIVRVRVENHLKIVHQRNLLESLASLDGLTGIPNRRNFDMVYQREWNRCQRENQVLSLLVLDVDQFKFYNDTLGHAAGDRVLQEVAHVLKVSAARSSDFVARYGGEEFSIILPNTNQEEAQQLAQKVLDNFRLRNLPHPKSTVADYVTVSIGGVSFIPASSKLPEYMFTLADEALYHAKQTGRNRFHWAIDEDLTN